MADAHDASGGTSGGHETAAGSLVADDELVDRALRDRAAFAELYRRYLPRVYGFALARLGDVQQAQDVTAQTFLAALEHLPTYRGPGTFVAWLLTIARHKTADQVRGRRATAPPMASLEEADQMASREPSPEDVVAARLELARVARTLRALAPERAEALSLRLFGELTTAEVAAIMGRSEAAVRLLVYRAVCDLRERLAFKSEAGV
jgi:RNA polymerase sigma-70 factor (ECF subfamily)